MEKSTPTPVCVKKRVRQPCFACAASTALRRAVCAGFISMPMAHVLLRRSATYPKKRLKTAIESPAEAG